MFGSSATTFLGGQSDRILLGRLLGASWLGIYSVATNLSDAIGVVITRVINGVMYPDSVKRDERRARASRRSSIA